MIMSLGVGLIAAIPEHGIVAILSRDDAGGLLARRLMVPILGLPLLLGWIRIIGQNNGLYDTEFGTAIRTLAEIILLGSMLWWTADGISRQAQIARIAENAAKDADRRKDEFLATLAHELRNPLAPIGNALAIIKQSGDDPLTLATARDSMERQFSQMVRLVDDLLDIGRITRDKLELRPQRLELTSIIQQSVEMSQTLVKASRHDLRIDLPARPVFIQADPVRLTQVFSNLLNNACKFTEPGGKISVSAEQRGAEVAVTVTDTGIGIATEELDRIFEMFSQVDQSLERKQSGLGIGLTLVKRLVELHSGRIEALSAGEGKGSTFVVFLPILANEPSTLIPPPKTSNQSDGTAPKRILVTDDNQDAAKSLSMLLRLNGHEVETVFDGESAVAKAETYRPDIMLLDIGLPDMNGYDVCRTIRQTPWGKSIRMVALTGWGQEQDRRNAREAGFDDHLVKPVDPQVLRRAVSASSS
jgi:signal transduction histidine kinase